jgi:enoyl-CoA hydratase/carnithine racemase
MGSEVLYERRGATALLTINRPERRNALSIETATSSARPGPALRQTRARWLPS